MSKEEVVSSFIMCIVCGLVLIGFTIAWFSNSDSTTVTGLEMEAVEMGHVKVALESGGKDISELPEGERAADFGVAAFTNLEADELAPGAFGEVNFYVTPVNTRVEACSIMSQLRITQDGSSFYPTVLEEAAGVGVENDASDSGTDADMESEALGGGTDVEGEAPEDGTELTMEALYELAQEHIEIYYKDDNGNLILFENVPYLLTWTEEERANAATVDDLEKKVTFYWKWHYTYPFTEDELTGEGALTEKQQEEKLLAYDIEDMTIGNNILGMKYYFTFTAR